MQEGEEECRKEKGGERNGGEAMKLAESGMKKRLGNERRAGCRGRRGTGIRKEQDGRGGKRDERGRGTKMREERDVKREEAPKEEGRVVETMGGERGEWRGQKRMLRSQVM